jgi:DNA-binding phage protein
MALTRDFKRTIQARVIRDAAFRRALLVEGVENLLAGEVNVGIAILRDYVNATVGFGKLASRLDRSPKSLMRMLSPSGNPRAQNLFPILAYLQKREGLKIGVKVKHTA